MQIWWQQVVEKIEAQEVAQDAAITAIAAAQAAAAAANTAAATANAAAATAQTAATTVTDAQEIVNSYVSGATLTASDAGASATITISAHTRHYPQADGTTISVAVNGGTLMGLAYSTAYWVYYDDATRAGGAVTYASTTNEGTSAQTGARHSVGAVTTPAAAGANTAGRAVRWPGYTQP